MKIVLSFIALTLLSNTALAQSFDPPPFDVPHTLGPSDIPIAPNYVPTVPTVPPRPYPNPQVDNDPDFYTKPFPSQPMRQIPRVEKPSGNGDVYSACILVAMEQNYPDMNHFCEAVALRFYQDQGD